VRKSSATTRPKRLMEPSGAAPIMAGHVICRTVGDYVISLLSIYFGAFWRLRAMCSSLWWLSREVALEGDLLCNQTGPSPVDPVDPPLLANRAVLRGFSECGSGSAWQA
jgi:hypothetical protein